MTPHYVVWKYPITAHSGTVHNMPAGAKVLHVGLDPEGVPCVWCLVRTSNAPMAIRFVVHGTGYPVQGAEHHVGTFMEPPYVWHVFLDTDHDPTVAANTTEDAS